MLSLKLPALLIQALRYSAYDIRYVSQQFDVVER